MRCRLPNFVTRKIKARKLTNSSFPFITMNFSLQQFYRRILGKYGGGIFAFYFIQNIMQNNLNAGNR